MKKYILSLIAIAPFFFFISGYFFSYFFMRSTVYKTPNLIGLKLSKALSMAAENHATIKLLHEQECPGVEGETIISQKPSAGRLIRPNQAILVTIAKETAQETAPDLKLQKLDVCKKQCKDLNIKIKNYPITYPLPQETCIGQVPSAKEAIPDKNIIIYTAQEKSNAYIMPNFINQDISHVSQLLEQQNIKYEVFLHYHKIEKPYADNLIVVDQKPKAGFLIHISDLLQVQLQVK